MVFILPEERNVDQTLENILEQNGYLNVVKFNGVVYGNLPLIFTGAICVGLDLVGYQRRYCYESMAEAIAHLIEWQNRDFKTTDPPGNWIVCKGRGGDYYNPRFIKNGV